MWSRICVVAGALLVGSGAIAGGKASPKPPAPPVVDFTVLPATASVQPKNPDGKNHPVHARLALDRAAVQPGSTARVGLHLTQMKDWHTYWKSPGDIGLPTDIEWTLPAGITVTTHQYPVPQRFEQDGQISYGYEDQVLLVADLKVDPGVAPGTYPIRAKAGWLVCLTSCIPGDAEIELPLVVGPEAGDSGFGKLFDHYVKQHPTDILGETGLTSEHAVTPSAVLPNHTFKVALKLTPTDGTRLVVGDDAWPTFTPIATSMDWMLTGFDLKATPDGGVLALLEGEAFEPDPLPKTDRAGGLFQVKLGDRWVRTEVMVPLNWAPTGTEVQPSTSPLWRLGVTDGGGGGVEGVADAAGAPDAEAVPLGVASPVAATGVTGSGLLLNLISAFIGGLLLNIMPCVLPVLTLKLYSLVEQVDITAKEQRVAGLAYTGGIVFSFLSLAVTVLVMRVAFGLEVDWGFQFQYPPYVAALATIVFVFGLSLFGVFEIPAFGVGTASEAGSREGPVGYFFTGVFATLLATPCSAPFLGTAIAFAFGAPTPVLLAIFTLVGIGLAFPFLVIAFVPALYRFLPKPGAWMEWFKQLLGFTLVLTAVWLTSVLMSQIGPDRAAQFMYFLVFVALGVWGYGHFGGLAATRQRQLIAAVGAIGVSTLAGYMLLDLQFAEESTCDDGSLAAELSFEDEIPWQSFSEERVAALSGQPVFIDFTADWCLTCKVNENAILETSPVRQAMNELGVVPLKADWTRRDPTITEWLRRYGRAGVPFYLVLPADPAASPIALPEVITQDTVIAAMREARG
ncbi:MAG: thiol:disulfide interchange protein [Myxococcota bacterium]|jgi:thiol:disulfide interchange protein